jgi:hypothetical protein
VSNPSTSDENTMEKLDTQISKDFIKDFLLKKDPVDIQEKNEEVDVTWYICIKKENGATYVDCLSVTPSSNKNKHSGTASKDIVLEGYFIKWVLGNVEEYDPKFTPHVFNSREEAMAVVEQNMEKYEKFDPEFGCTVFIKSFEFVKKINKKYIRPRNRKSEKERKKKKNV